MVDLDNYYTKTEVDEAIANIDIPEGEIVDEVFIGTEQPTDENIKIWVNPEEQLDFATKEYVDEAIANIDIPSGDGNFEKEVISIPFSFWDINTIPDGKAKNEALKQKLLDAIANGVSNYLFIYENTNNTVLLNANYNTSNTTLTLVGLSGNYIYDDLKIVYVNFRKSDLESSAYGDKHETIIYSKLVRSASGVPEPKNWNWQSGDGTNSFNAYSYSHIKVLAYVNDSSYTHTFDISTSNGNIFGEEYGSRYEKIFRYDGRTYEIRFYNEGGTIQWDTGISDIDNGDYASFNVIGYYYWG